MRVLDTLAGFLPHYDPNVEGDADAGAPCPILETAEDRRARADIACFGISGVTEPDEVAARRADGPRFRRRWARHRPE